MEWLHVSLHSGWNEYSKYICFWCFGIYKVKANEKTWRCYKKTRILLYRGNLNKGKILYPYEKITLIIREDVLLEGEGMVCL